MEENKENKEYDLYKDSLVRFLGYANEFGEVLHCFYSTELLIFISSHLPLHSSFISSFISSHLPLHSSSFISSYLLILTPLYQPLLFETTKGISSTNTKGTCHVKVKEN